VAKSLTCLRNEAAEHTEDQLRGKLPYMFGFIRSVFSLLGFLVCLLVVTFLLRAQLVLFVVQNAIEKTTGYRLLASAPQLRGLWPVEFRLERAVLLNPPEFPQSGFLFLRNTYVKCSSLSLFKGLDIENITLDIEQVIITKTQQGTLNYQLPSHHWTLFSVFTIREVNLTINTMLYYDYNAAPQPLPKYFVLQHRARCGPMRSLSELAQVVIEPVHLVLLQYGLVGYEKPTIQLPR